MKRSLSALALSLLAGAAAAQTPAAAERGPAAPAAVAPAPAASAAAQPAAAQPRKPLVLRLDEIDGPRMSFGASQGETFKKDDLPDIGKPSPAWQTPPERAAPKETGSDAY